MDPDRVAAVMAIEADAAAGEAPFDANCRGCHGPDGVGVPLGGPSLRAESIGREAVVIQVLGGDFGMPAFDGELDDGTIANVAAWVTESLPAPE